MTLVTARYEPSYLRYLNAWVIIDRLEYGYCRLRDQTGTLQELRFPTEANAELWLTWMRQAGGMMNVLEPDQTKWPLARRRAAA